MTQYQQVKINNIVQNDQILKIVDGTIYYVPNDQNNRDWKDYQLWLSLGNTPLTAV